MIHLACTRDKLLEYTKGAQMLGVLCNKNIFVIANMTGDPEKDMHTFFMLHEKSTKMERSGKYNPFTSPIPFIINSDGSLSEYRPPMAGEDVHGIVVTGSVGKDGEIDIHGMIDMPGGR